MKEITRWDHLKDNITLENEVKLSSLSFFKVFKIWSRLGHIIRRNLNPIRRGIGDLRFEDLKLQFLDGLKMLCVTGH